MITDILEYMPHSIQHQVLMKRATGSVSAAAFDRGQQSPENTSAFETLIQIIEGKAEIIVQDKPYTVSVGQFFIIPAHTRATIKAPERFKMISTVIKSGYEDVSF